MTENVELMRQARESLSGRWGLAIGTFVVYALVTSAIQFIPFVGIFGSLLVSGPFALGIVIFVLSITRKTREPQLADI